jgi:hypothetical protein
MVCENYELFPGRCASIKGLISLEAFPILRLEIEGSSHWVPRSPGNVFRPPYHSP